MSCRIILSAPVSFSFLWTLDSVLRTWTWALQYKKIVTLSTGGHAKNESPPIKLVRGTVAMFSTLFGVESVTVLLFRQLISEDK